MSLVSFSWLHWPQENERLLYLRYILRSEFLSKLPHAEVARRSEFELINSGSERDLGLADFRTSDLLGFDAKILAGIR